MRRLARRDLRLTPGNPAPGPHQGRIATRDRELRDARVLRRRRDAGDHRQGQRRLGGHRDAGRPGDDRLRRRLRCLFAGPTPDGDTQALLAGAERRFTTGFTGTRE
jgi:hypothetical protein